MVLILNLAERGAVALLGLDLRRRQNIAITTLEGRINSNEIKKFAKQMNDDINETDQVPILVLHTKSVPYWTGFNALKKHWKFIRNHYALVVKLRSSAIVLWLDKTMVDHFVNAKVRWFNADVIDNAIARAQIGGGHSGEILEMDGLPPDDIGIDIRGLITS